MFGSIIQGLFNMANSGLNYGLNNAANRKQFERADTWDKGMRLRDKEDTAYYWDLYNSPSAQMKSYEEAGLNPNLIYGQSNSVNPVHSGGSSPRDNFVGMDIASPIAAAMEAYYKDKEDKRQDAANAAYVANLEASAKSKNVQSANDAIKGDLLAQQKVINELRIEYERTSNPLKRKFLETQINNVTQQMERDLWLRSLEERKFGLDKQRFYESVRQFKVNDDFRKDPLNRLNPWAQVGMKLIEELSGHSLKESLKDLWNSTKSSFVSGLGGAGSFY